MGVHANEGGEAWFSTNSYANKKHYYFCWWKKLDFLIEYKFVNITGKLRTSKISMNSQVDEF